MRCRCKRLVHISQNVKLTPHFLKRLKQPSLTRKFRRSIAHNALVPVSGLAITSHLLKLSLHLRHTISSGLHFSVDAAVRHHRFYKLQQSMPSLTDLSHSIKIRRFLDRLKLLVKRMLNESSLKTKPLFTPKLHLRELNFEWTKILQASTSAARGIFHSQGRT